MRDARSSSCVDKGVLDACELRETELSEGDRTPGRIAGLGLLAASGGAGGPRLFPFPSTRPPPRLRREAMLRYE